MKTSERKKSLVEELSNFHKALNVEQMFRDPEHKTTKDWLAETASILKQLDENDYQELIRLGKTINPAVFLPKRKEAAHEIDSFVRRKVAEWQRCDFSSLDSERIAPKLTFGEPGTAGQPGGGGSVFIQAENFTVNGGGRITANGGDYIVHQNELNNFGTISQTIAEAINNITKLTQVISQSKLGEAEKRQLIGDIETIKAQLIKPNPDKSILQKSWGAIQVAATIGGAAKLFTMIGQIVLPLLN